MILDASSLADPLSASYLLAAIRWLEGTLLGTTVAVIAIAWVGAMMLTGRV